MPNSEPVALRFKVETNECIAVVFGDDYELQIRTHAIRVGYRPVIRNVQLFRSEIRIGQYDGDIVESSRKDPHAQVFHPHVLTFGDANEFIAFWRAALDFIAARFIQNKRKPVKSEFEDIYLASSIESRCRPHLKKLIRNTVQRSRNNERRR